MATELELIIRISDNGIGIEPERLAKLQSDLLKPLSFVEKNLTETRHIGLKNVHSRILLYYGQGYGLSIASKLNCGTTVTIKLPYRGGIEHV